VNQFGKTLQSKFWRSSLLLSATGVALLSAGCGNSYRPVVSAINPVGPAGQPTKYAVAVSNTNATLVDLITAYSIANNVITVTVATPNPFAAGQTLLLSGFTTSTFLNGQSVTVLSTGLTTTQFQATFTHANASATESGSASQLGSSLGLLTFVDFSGDTILSTPSILTNPSYFTQTANGVEGFVINAAGSFDTFGMSNPTGLQTQNILQTTLPATSGPVSLSALSVLGTGTTIFVPEQATSKIAELSSSGPTLTQEISVGANPMYVVGIDGAPRVYAISQNTSGNGQVASIESSTLSVSATIPVGAQPVYGVMSADAKRTYILNKGSGNVTVINTFTNALDTTTPVIPATGTLGLNPVWADLSTLTNELVVLNAGDGVHAGSLSIINIPLCTASTPVTNPNCSSTNPVDATGFGQVLATVPVGISPTMVSVLHDGSRAYVANTLDSTGQCAAGQGSVSVVNLTSGVVTATICGTTSAVNANDAPTLLYGHPNTIAATTGTPTGKVYVTSSDSRFLSVIYTDTDSVQTHISLQGLGLRVVVTQP
jgi:DNA-binding beta-propeller fold protein YncE